MKIWQCYSGIAAQTWTYTSDHRLQLVCERKKMGSSIATNDAIKADRRSVPQKGEFWWANAIFFVGVHLAACIGMYYRPAWAVPRATLVLGTLAWQLSCFGYVRCFYLRLLLRKRFSCSRAE